MGTNIDKNSIKFIYGTKCHNALEVFLSQHIRTPSLALLGRSNVGKSTLINALFGRKAARTSKTPGRTRQVNIFTFQLEECAPSLLLFDLPGHGFAKVSKSEQQNWQLLMDTFFACAGPLTALICLQDARHPEQKEDRELYRYLKNFALESFLVLNKMDKIKTQREKSVLKKAWMEILSRHQWFKNIFQVSAQKNLGMESLESALVAHLLEKVQTSS